MSKRPFKMKGFSGFKNSPIKKKESPIKNYQNPEQYKVFNMGNVADELTSEEKDAFGDSPADMGARKSTTSPTYMKSSSFKMKGSPYKLGEIEGTSAHASALKLVEAYPTIGTGTTSRGKDIEKKAEEYKSLFKGGKNIDWARFGATSHEDFLRQYPTASAYTGEEVVREEGKEGEVKAVPYFSTYQEFEDRLRAGEAVDFEQSFTGKELIAAANDAGDLISDEYRQELISKGEQQLGTKEKYPTSDVASEEYSKQESTWLADNPGKDESDFQAYMEQTNPDILDAMFGDGIVEGDKEKFDIEFIDRMKKKGMSDEEAAAKLAEYYAKIEERIPEGKTGAMDE